MATIGSLICYYCMSLCRKHRDMTEHRTKKNYRYKLLFLCFNLCVILSVYNFREFVKSLTLLEVPPIVILQYIWYKCFLQQKQLTFYLEVRVFHLHLFLYFSLIIFELWYFDMLFCCQVGLECSHQYLMQATECLTQAVSIALNRHMKVQQLIIVHALLTETISIIITVLIILLKLCLITGAKRAHQLYYTTIAEQPFFGPWLL